MPRPAAFKVEIEFTSGVWTDVSAYVQNSDEVSIRRGRNTVLDTAQIGTCSFTLIGDDGRFTPGYNGSPYYPNVIPNKRVRVTVNTSYVRFLGYIDKWDPTFPDGGSNNVIVQVTATDQGRILARQALNSTYVEQVESLSTSASVWQCDETAGTSFSDALGVRDAATLRTPKAPTGGVSYAGDTGAPYVDKGISLVPSAWGSGLAGYYSGRLVQVPVIPTGDFTLAWWVKPSVVDLSADGARFAGTWFGNSGLTGDYLDYTVTYFAGPTYWQLNHRDVAASASGPAPTTDTYLFLTLVSSGSNAYLYVNGSLVITLPLGGSPRALKLRPMIGGVWCESKLLFGLGTRNENAGSVYNSAGGVISDITYLDSALAAGNIANLYTAGTTGFNGDTANARATRIASYSGVTSTSFDADTFRVGPLNTAGKDSVSLMQELAVGAYGLAYFDGSGMLRWNNSRQRRATLTPAATFANEADLAGDAISLPIEDARFYNAVTVKATGGGSYTAENTTSIAAVGLVSLSQDLNLYSSSEARDRASWWVTVFGTPQVRISQVEVDMMTSGTGAGIYATVFALDLDSRIRLTGLPTAGPASQLDAYIEGWTETYSISSASIVFDCSPADAPAQTMIADNSPGPYAAAYDLVARLDCDGSQYLWQPVTTAATSLEVVTPGVRFTTTDTPFEIEMNDEIMSVSAVSAAATRTNLSTNPSFETGVGLWFTNGAGTTVTQTTSEAVSASASALITRNASSGSGIYSDTLTVSAGVQYTASAYVKSPTGSGTFTVGIGISWLNSGVSTGSAGPSTVTLTAGAGWQRVTLTGTSPALTNQARITLYTQAAGTAGQTFLVDAVMLEAVSSAQPYFDGQWLGASWTGTAHASTSTLTTQILTVARGQYGTNAFAHTDATPVYLARTPGLSF